MKRVSGRSATTWGCPVSWSLSSHGSAARNVRLTVLVVIAGAYCAALSMALVYYAGSSFTAVMIVLPTLIFVLVISASVHLVNYYRDAIREGGLAGRLSDCAGTR